MYVHSVKLINFKSIGNSDLSEIIIEPKITAIIGKNESGKSNVLDGLSYISFTQDMTAAFAKDNVNRNNETNAEIKYIIVLKPSEHEKNDNIINTDTTVTLTKELFTTVGGAVDYYNRCIKSNIDKLMEALGDNPFQLRDNEYQKYRNYVNELAKTDALNIRKINEAVHYIDLHIANFKAENKEGIKQLLEKIKSIWSTYITLFPTVFYRNTDKTLQSQYRYEDVQNELKSPASYPNSLLSDFVHLIQIPDNDFLFAVQSGVSGNKTTVRKRIQRNIDKYVNSAFNDFYKTESISLTVDFDANFLYFSVQSENGESFLLSERSNGLRWYLNTFIDSKAHDISNSNVLYLLDEPGVSLHVNAQRELLKLFKHLADQANQVVYTTHSPYMLDTNENGIHRIRAVVKSSDGYTSIYKTAYDARIAPESQEDTLAPIMKAIGMNFQDTIGPAKDKINIVIEGMSDYIYLSTMAKVLKIDDSKYVLIPSVGASNCVNICTILYGWGCHYIALFDYDKAGVETGGELMRKELLFEYGKQYCYILNVSQQDIDNHTYLKNSYMIEDLIDREEIKRFCTETKCSNKIGKPLMAKLMCNAIESGEFILHESSEEHFKALFERIRHIR